VGAGIVRNDQLLYNINLLSLPTCTEAGHRHPLERLAYTGARWHPDPGPMALPSEGVS
jgi:hypothetical protein